MDFRIEHSEQGDWEGLFFTLFLVRPLNPEHEDRFRQLVVAWYTVCIYNGLGEGVPHFLSDIGVEEEDGQHRVEWWVDMGSLEPEALTMLERCIEHFIEREDIKATKLTVGQGPFH